MFVAAGHQLLDCGYHKRGLVQDLKWEHPPHQQHLLESPVPLDQGLPHHLHSHGTWTWGEDQWPRWRGGMPEQKKLGPVVHLHQETWLHNPETMAMEHNPETMRMEQSRIKHLNVEF
jgi:hypothetical protein